MIEDTAALSRTIVAAVKEVGCRLILQSSWSKLGGDDLPEGMLCIGPCPHDWLLPQVAAVIHHVSSRLVTSHHVLSRLITPQVAAVIHHVSSRLVTSHHVLSRLITPQVAAVIHHGGAGTVAAGLRFGKPTMVCPFFGDQHFWGEMVKRAKVGPPPVPIGELDEQKLAEGLRVLIGEEARAAAKAVAAGMAQESGVLGGQQSFHHHLPLDDMVCDVSTLLGTPQPAELYYRTW